MEICSGHILLTIKSFFLTFIYSIVHCCVFKKLQARFELDEEYQKIAVIKQMGCLWRCSKSRLVTKIRNAPTNKARMEMRPKNVPINDWRKFVRMKTSKSFKVKITELQFLSYCHNVS